MATVVPVTHGTEDEAAPGTTHGIDWVGFAYRGHPVGIRPFARLPLPAARGGTACRAIDRPRELNPSHR